MTERAKEGKQTIPGDLVPLFTYSTGEDGWRNFKVHCAYSLKSCRKLRRRLGINDK